MNVLLIAPTDGEDVGEAWVAYQWTKLLSEQHIVTLLTYRKRGKPSAISQLPNTRVVEWVEPPGLGRLERLNSMLKPTWIPFYFLARRWIRRALSSGELFDVVHQPVPVAMRYPSPAAGLGIPLIIGPVGGSLSSPPGFAGDDTAPWYVGLRRFDEFRLNHDPLLRRTYRDAACVIGIAPYVRDLLATVPLRRFDVMSETGIASLPSKINRAGRKGSVRLLFVGRVIRTKGARDVIHALAHLGDLDLVLDVVGDGFDRAECERAARRLGVADRVAFHGTVAKDKVAQYYEDADIFAFPSYREPGGNVVFEAMRAGLPLIVADRGGPGNVVDDNCGFRLRPGEPAQYAVDIAAAIRSLASDEALRLRLGEGARERARQVALWSTRVTQIEQIYAACSVR